MSKNLNIMRTLRLQLKTGYLAQEPASYRFMMRYPPLTRDTAAPNRDKVDVKKIPYLHLYDKAITKNPLYIDERVYPAYWQHEPQALTLAKKQYEMMQNGMTEEQAYKEAVKYVDVLESKAYEEAQLSHDVILQKGGKATFVADKGVMASIEQWSAILQTTSYDSLSLADKGEIDYLIQTKILKWHEVERERRMKDPMFVMLFEKLRNSIFPEIEKSFQDVEVSKRAEYKTGILQFFNVSKNRLVTNSQFFYEDYVRFFNMAKAQPIMMRWPETERDQLSRWVVNTLAFREILETSAPGKIQSYLDQLKAQFFPMLRYVDRAASFVLPAEAQIKALLYNNDVGYKAVREKLFIKRFYRLPGLLFPKESFTTSLLWDEERLRTVMQDGSELLKEMATAGFDEASKSDIESQLKTYMNMNKSASTHVYSSEVDMSGLDAMLRWVRHDDDDSCSSSSSESDKLRKDTQSSSVTPLSADATDAASSSSPHAEDAAWQELVSKYSKTPVTKLETDRENHYSPHYLMTLADCRDEVDLKSFWRHRYDLEAVARARMSLLYEQKEAARRHKSWEDRGMYLEKLGQPPLMLNP